ncbi:MAG: FGGY family carbohydrate kinase [Bacteroidota bacterium]
MFYLGIDLGSSSIKIALVEQHTGKSVGIVKMPQDEMPIYAPQKGWAEQDPEDWWKHICTGIESIKEQTGITKEAIIGIGIAYQMHGLVLVDHNGKLLRKAIIWCDSRAVTIGNNAYTAIGAKKCQSTLLNSPANFTASKLKWVRENEPKVYAKSYKFMLPGDYIAFRFSGTIKTTVPGLSEGIFWNFKEDMLSEEILGYYGIEKSMVPEVVDTFGQQAVVNQKGAAESGLNEQTPVLYRAGDQPNNALSLNVFHPGAIAATAGTSGVMYAITDTLSAKESTRVNNFAHVNYGKSKPKRIGKLLCINGTGIQYRWLQQNLGLSDYDTMNQLAQQIPIGADGIVVLPFGNGAERMLENKNIGSNILNIDFNRHTKSHIIRAALEGIAFAFVYGFEILRSDGIIPQTIRAGNDNLFKSTVFSDTITALLQKEIQIFNTTGAIGAARACMLHRGDYSTFSKVIMDHDHEMTHFPKQNNESYVTAYKNWKKTLEQLLNH